MASAHNQHKVLSEAEVLEMMKHDVSLAQATIYLPVSSVRLLLHHFKWDLLALTDSYFTDEELTMKMANCVENKTEASSVTDFSSLICSKCLGDLDKTIIKHGPCGHAFCPPCCLEYLRQSIVKEGKSLRIECPVSICSFLLDDAFVTNVCSEDQSLLETYWSFLAKSYIEKTETLTKCPGQKCKNTVFLADPSCCKVQCSCGEEFCFECASPFHYSFPCILIKDWEEVTLGSCTRHNYMLRMTKKCPKCKMDMMKNEENIGMCCSWCDLVVCSRCLEPLKDHIHCEEEVAFEHQEITNEDDKINERKFQYFHGKYQEMKLNIGYLNIDIWYLLTHRTDAHYEILMQKLPFEISSTPSPEGSHCINTEEIIQVIRSETVETKELDWFPTVHMDKAARALEETKRIIMYSQIFASFLGCKSSENKITNSNHQKAMDADLFLLALESLNQSLANLKKSLLKIIHAFLNLKSKLILCEHETKTVPKYGMKAFVENILKTQGDVMTNTEICIKNKDTVLSLMEEGFGDRIWKFDKM